ncbi:MAG: hypothetical protein ACREQA_17200 [Candidatus Binatia bacterium]
MAKKQERIQKPRVIVEKNTREEVIDGDNRTRTAKKAEALKQELDAELDAIDALLAETGQTDEEVQAFVEGFKQHGGQ